MNSIVRRAKLALLALATALLLAGCQYFNLVTFSVTVVGGEYGDVFVGSEEVVTVAGEGAGTVSVQNSDDETSTTAEFTYFNGYPAEVTLVATPSGESTFAEWSGDCTGTDATCTLATDGDKSVTATFDPPPPEPDPEP